GAPRPGGALARGLLRRGRERRDAGDRGDDAAGDHAGGAVHGARGCLVGGPLQPAALHRPGDRHEHVQTGAQRPRLLAARPPRRSAPASARQPSGEQPAKVAEAEFRRTLAQGLKLVLLAVVPATIALIVLRLPIVEILFQRGRFAAADSERTALAFLFYSPGLPSAAL